VSPLYANEQLYSDISLNKVINLATNECKVYSQNGEDGIIRKIFECIGCSSHYYVEFGVENGTECNTRFLREKGWTGLLLMDGGYSNHKIHLYKEFITAENINSLFKKYHIPDEFDLLSIDVDFNDFYIWKAIASQYKPRVVVIEYNATHLPHEDKVVIYSPHNTWDGTNYFGASILALYRLGRLKGYSLVYAEAAGANLFFIRDDLLHLFEASGYRFRDTNNVDALYNYPKYGCGPNGGHKQDPYHRPFISSKELL
jgi:hypothetical protein